jgi:hypothetical protein
VFTVGSVLPPVVKGVQILVWTETSALDLRTCRETKMATRLETHSETRSAIRFLRIQGNTPRHTAGWREHAWRQCDTGRHSIVANGTGGKCCSVLHRPADLYFFGPLNRHWQGSGSWTMKRWQPGYKAVDRSLSSMVFNALASRWDKCLDRRGD